MAFDLYRNREAGSSSDGASLRSAPDFALGLLLVGVLVAGLFPSTQKYLEIPMMLLVGVTAMLLFIRASDTRRNSPISLGSSAGSDDDSSDLRRKLRASMKETP